MFLFPHSFNLFFYSKLVLKFVARLSIVTYFLFYIINPFIFLFGVLVYTVWYMHVCVACRMRNLYFVQL